MNTRFGRLAITLLLWIHQSASGQNGPCQAGYQGQDFIVGVVPGAAATDVLTQLRSVSDDIGLSVDQLGTFDSLDAVHFQIPEARPADVDFVAAWLRLLPGVRFVDRNIAYYSTARYPTSQSDPKLRDRDNIRHLQRIMADRAWMEIEPDPDMIIAVIDAGLDLDHPDVIQNLWADSNGYHGYDFVENDNDPSPGNRNGGGDLNEHGTHVSGTIGARGLNELGTAGVAWQTRIMPVRFLNGAGCGSLNNALKALNYAIANGASIINMSFGSTEDADGLRIALEKAAERDILLVASAGQGANSSNTDNTPHYPSCYEIDGLISVTATGTTSDRKVDGANYGRSSVDFGAPGLEIHSTIPNGSYGTMTGTSMATALTSGAAALVRSRWPGLSAVEVKELLLKTVDPARQLRGLVRTGGRLNLLNAISVTHLTREYEKSIQNLDEAYQQTLRNQFATLSDEEKVLFFVHHVKVQN